MGVITHGAVLQNEVKAWPPLVRIGSGFDLVTNAQWFADVATPTTKATAVPSSGEAGLDAKFTEVIKCVTDAANEGWKQRYTYADEPRIKAGAHLSALIWVATTGGGSGITAKLVNSDASSTTGTSVATDGDWTLLAIVDHTCAGTYVELQVTKDASGTFYAGGPITVNVGLNAIGLPPRKLVERHLPSPVQLVSLAGSVDPNAWTDVDCTSGTSALAAVVYYRAKLFEPVSSYSLYVRRNGSSDAASNPTEVATVTVDSQFQNNDGVVILDDAQIFEYLLDRWSGSSALDDGYIHAVGYGEFE